VQQHAAPSMPVSEIVTYPQFGFTIQRAGEDGAARVVTIFTPSGKQINLPLDSASAKEMSERLLAPSVPGNQGVVVPEK
jgi:hypothetical protein